MTFRPAYASTFFASVLTGYAGSYAISVPYERAPTTLKYYKPIFYADNAFARFTDLYVPPLFIGTMVCTTQEEWIKNSVVLGPLFYAVARSMGTAFATGTYFAGGILATVAWKLQSNFNPDKNDTIYDRNTGTGGALCALAGVGLTIPMASMFKTINAPVLPLALGFIAERTYDEYGRKYFQEEKLTVPAIHQWGGTAAAIFGVICGFTKLRTGAGHAMKNQFTKNFGPKWKG